MKKQVKLIKPSQIPRDMHTTVRVNKEILEYFKKKGVCPSSVWSDYIDQHYPAIEETTTRKIVEKKGA